MSPPPRTGPGSSRPRTPRFFLLLMAATALVLGLCLLPLAVELLIALVLAVVLIPLQDLLVRRFRMRRGLAAGILVVMAILLALGPISGLTALAVRDGERGVNFILDTARSEDVRDLISVLPDWAARSVRKSIRELPSDYQDVIDHMTRGRGAKAAQGVAVEAMTTGGSLLFHTAMMVIALFFLLAHGHHLVAWIDQVSPLPHGQTRELLQTFKKVSYSVFVATLVTGAVQAGAALVGFLVAPVPSPFFFAIITFLCALVPVIGAAVVVCAAAGLLLLTGHPYWALFLAVWGIAVVGLVDNVVKPLLIRRGMEVHGAVVFFALIGGLAAFGAIGLLIGPLVVSMFLALLRMYHRDYAGKLADLPPVPGGRT